MTKKQGKIKKKTNNKSSNEQPSNYIQQQLKYASQSETNSETNSDLDSAIKQQQNRLQALKGDNKVQQQKYKKQERIATGLVMLAVFWLFLCAGSIYWSLLIQYFGTTAFSELVALSRVETKDSMNSFTGPAFDYFIFIIMQLFLLPRLVFPNELLLMNDINLQTQMPPLYMLMFSWNEEIIALMCTVALFWFVMSLQTGNSRYQFKRLCLIVVGAGYISVAHCGLQALYYFGKFWVFIPQGCIMINDTFAYFWGLGFGKTRLITLSPNKTVEGFMGGFGSTLVAVYIFANFFFMYPQIICPTSTVTLRPFVTESQDCAVPKAFENNLRFGLEPSQFVTSEAMILALCFAVFSSLAAPFAGFFASGMKRVYDIKDFGTILPGHGGFVDRFDCHFTNIIFGLTITAAILPEIRNDRFLDNFMQNGHILGSSSDELILSQKQYILSQF